MPRRDKSEYDEYDDEDEIERPRRRGRRRDPLDDPSMGYVLPVNVSGWAIAAGYLALFSVLCLPSPAALFCGIMAVRDIRRKPKRHGLGRAWFGIVMGGIGTLASGAIVVALILDRK